MQRSKTATDLGALEQVAKAVTPTAPTGKHRSNMQHLYDKYNNSHPTPRPIVTSITSHPTLVVDRRATRPASLARTTKARVMGPSGAHHPSATRRTAERPLVLQTKGKPTLSKSTDSRRSQRRRRSSPHSRTEKGARSSSSSRSGQWEKYTACKPRRRPSINRATTRKMSPTVVSEATAACQSRQHQGHSSGETTRAALRRAGRYLTFETCQLSTPWEKSPNAYPRRGTTISPMQSHHPKRRKLQHQLNRHQHCRRQPRQHSGHYRHSRARHNTQPTQRRRDDAERRSTTGTTKRYPDHDSRTNTSPLLILTHAEQSLKVSDLLPESRNGIATAYQKINLWSYQLRRVSYGSATPNKQCHHGTCTIPIRM